MIRTELRKTGWTYLVNILGGETGCDAWTLKCLLSAFRWVLQERSERWWETVVKILTRFIVWRKNLGSSILWLIVLFCINEHSLARISFSSLSASWTQWHKRKLPLASLRIPSVLPSRSLTPGPFRGRKRSDSGFYPLTAQWAFCLYRHGCLRVYLWYLWFASISKLQLLTWGVNSKEKGINAIVILKLTWYILFSYFLFKTF